MIQLSVRDIAEATGGYVYSDNLNACVNGWSIDSRTIKPGNFFIAVKGNNFDGHAFLPDAVENGASGLIVKHDSKDIALSLSARVITVDDTLEAMGMIAARIRRQIDIPCIAITGSNGKTSVKDILSHILSSKYKVLKSQKSYNNLVGLSLTVFELDASYDVLVLELGTNHPGEISKLAWIARPYMAIITNIGNSHLEFFSDKNGVFKEKTSLLNFLPPTGVAFLNRDDVLLAGLSGRNILKRFYGKSEKADFQIKDVNKKNNGYEFFINNEQYYTPLEGMHNVYNVASAIAAAKYFELDYEEINERVKKVVLSGMRLEKVTVGDIVFINDAYNANPDSFESALKVLENSHTAGKKGVVAGDMLELGAGSEEFHRALGRKIKETGADFFIAYGEKMLHAAEGAKEAGMKNENIFCVKGHKDAAELIKRIASPGTVVLLKGSRTMKMEEVLKCFTTFYTR